MAENINRGLGRGSGFQLDKGGVPTESGPFIGVVKNNIDPTRSGRIQAYIETYGGNETDPATWRTLNYLSPFMGVTNQNNLNYGTEGTGDFGNRQSYGMWFSAPDVGTKVLCFFANGDPNQGFYLLALAMPTSRHYWRWLHCGVEHWPTVRQTVVSNGLWQAVLFHLLPRIRHNSACWAIPLRIYW